MKQNSTQTQVEPQLVLKPNCSSTDISKWLCHCGDSTLPPPRSHSMGEGERILLGIAGPVDVKFVNTGCYAWFVLADVLPTSHCAEHRRVRCIRGYAYLLEINSY